MIPPHKLRRGSLTGIACLAILVSVWLLLGGPSEEGPQPAFDPRSALEAVDDDAGDLAAAAAEVLARRAILEADPLADGPAPTLHRRGAGTRQVALVIDRATGSPVPGALVEFHDTPLLRAVWHRDTLFDRQPVARAEAEADGSIWLPADLRGVLHAEVAGPTHHSVDFVRVHLTSDAVEPALLMAAQGGRVEGRVLTRSFEPAAPARVLAVPAAAAMIDIMSGGHPVLRTAAVAPDGTFELGGVPAGQGWRIAALDGTFSPTTSAPITLRPGEVVVTDIIVAPTRTLFGGVYGADGQPVANAQVSYVTKPPRGFAGFDLVARYTAPHRQTYTDDFGRFALAGIPADSAHIWATHPALGASERRPIDLGAEPLPFVSLALDPGTGVRGRVLDPTGAPIVNATITWLGPKNRGQPLPAEARASTRPDARGEFWLPLPGREDAEKGFVLVTARGFARAVEAVEVPAERAITVTLQPGLSIGGTVTASLTGKPVESFTLTIDAPEAIRGLGREARGAVELPVRSPAGTFRTADEFGGQVELSVASEGYDTFHLTLDLDAADASALRIELDPALALRGVVVDRGGAPIDGATVTASSWRMSGVFNINDTSDSRRATTDGAGRFELLGVRPSEDKYVSVTHEGFLPIENQRVRPGAGTYEEQRFVMARGGAIFGQVTDESGAPCAGHEVVALAIGGAGAIRRATTDPAGQYRLDVMDPDLAWSLTVLAEDATFDLQQILAGVAAKNVRVGPDEVQRVDLVFAGTGTATLRGRISRDDGSGIAGAEITLVDGSAADAHGLTGSFRARADEAGRFVIENVRAGEYEAVYGHYTGMGRNLALVGRQPISLLDGQLQDVELVLPGGEITGKVVDAVTGQPVRGAQVLLTASGGPQRTPHNGMLRRLASRHTDTGGDFAFRSVPAGVYRVVVVPPAGSVYAGQVAGPVDVSGPSAASSLSIRLANGVLLRALVRDEEGPVSGARLQLRQASGAVLSPTALSQRDGSIETVEAPAGTWIITAHEGERASAPQVLVIPETGLVSVELSLPR